jgi:hypothetical protein
MVLVAALAGCAGGTKAGDTAAGGPSVQDDGLDGDGDTGICSLATDPDRDGYCFDDCAPDDPSIHPGAVEQCNETDDDCDGEVDEGAGVVWYLDEDGDGWGGEAVSQCDPPASHADNGADCDDGDATVHPGAEELDDGLDNDCDDEIDEGGGGGDGLSATAAWDREGLIVELTGGTAGSYELGLSETGAGSGGWYGETCVPGAEPGGVDDYGYDVCHSLGAAGGSIESVYPEVGLVDDGATLFHQGLAGNLTYFLADPASADCWVWGDDPGYYTAFGCERL